MKPDGVIGKRVQRIAATRTFARVAPKVVPRVDRALHRLTRGRVLMSAAMLPTLLLTAIGATSGLPRTVPIATLPEPDGSFLVVGSNFGRENHPAWTNNLLAHPRATVAFGWRTYTVEARLLDGDERAKVWPKLLAMWPNYDKYAERSERDLRVFRLTPV